MDDQSDVRIPLRENPDPRRINLVVLCTLFAGAMAFGFAYLLIPKLNQQAGPRAFNVAILDEPGTSGRAERFAVVTGGGRIVESPTGTDYRAATGRPATFIDIIDGTPQYVGHLVRIDGASVQTVPGDKIFSIGPTEADSILVKMDEPTNPGHKGEHQLVVQPRDTVFLVGRLLKMPPVSTLRKWGLNDKERDQIGRQSAYIKANLVEDAP
ncbi:hypothetical protein [Fimbriimonas ginsengisoli]|uniref:Uncharacterized protein n=1 Tax=Fimbriimonas ginsengisoli Gsoil 348 TaxID=661478 RepID=A0A068NY34_FIMGI|nr:hypothetical protein [Fimbriimonas ginsengisoli]AIE87805.1 hypothetical protein OP10G_4437 [Fimbriimonas ginsengisoli Gsoil 348]